MKRKGAIIAGAIVTVVVVVILLVQFVLIPMYSGQSWGAEGDLTLSLTADRASMDLDGSLNLTYTLRNVGDTDVRLIYPTFHRCFSNVGIFNRTGQHVYGPPCPDHMPPLMKDDDLHVLRSGEMVSFKVVITNDSYHMEKGETYHAFARYYSGDHERITLPYWKGELGSEKVYFDVDP